MLLQEPAESPYDLRFELFGFPIRIAWTFWLGAVVFGWDFVVLFDEIGGNQSPGRLALLVLWAFALLTSILIHELGHAFAFRQYGTESSIVLYHFGGLAIPSSSRNVWDTSGGFASSFSPPRLSHSADLWIALAGPLAQMVSAVALIACVKFAGYSVFAFELMPGPLRKFPGVLEGAPIDSFGLLALVTFYVFPSILWALLNLVPVFPLDGGRVMRSLVMLSGGRSDTWLWISLFSAGACAFYGMTNGQLFMGILFLSLAMGNYQMLQGPRGY
ncbi:MAG: site-2 protease family protein [Planctomycetota bacterium]